MWNICEASSFPSLSTASGQSDSRIRQRRGIIITFVPQLRKIHVLTDILKTCRNVFRRPMRALLFQCKSPSLFCSFQSFLHVFHDSATKAPLLISVWQNLATFNTTQDKCPRRMMFRHLEMCKILVSKKIWCQTDLVPKKDSVLHRNIPNSRMC